MSPNEGGSGASMPLFADFCTVMLGWTALHEMACNGGGMTSSTAATTTTSATTTSQRQTLHPTTIERNHQKVHREATSLEQALAQSTTRINRNTTTRSEIESELVCFQRYVQSILCFFSCLDNLHFLTPLHFTPSLPLVHSLVEKIEVWKFLPLVVVHEVSILLLKVCWHE